MTMHKIKIGEIAKYDTLISAGILYPMLLEIILNLIFLPPNLEGVYKLKGSIYVHYDYSNLFNFSLINSSETNTAYQLKDVEKTPVVLYYGLSNVLTIFVIIRCYHFIRVIHTFSYWST